MESSTNERSEKIAKMLDEVFTLHFQKIGEMLDASFERMDKMFDRLDDNISNRFDKFNENVEKQLDTQEDLDQRGIFASMIRMAKGVTYEEELESLTRKHGMIVQQYPDYVLVQVRYPEYLSERERREIERLYAGEKVIIEKRPEPEEIQDEIDY
ncbi:MAG: hypothetical protein ACYCQJ_13130 [Nitrososphaerales archaeon]